MRASKLNPYKPPRHSIGGAALCILVLLLARTSLASERMDYASLPAPINEASGLAASHRHPGVYWTHNDNIDLPASSRKSQPIIFALGGGALPDQLQGSVTLTGATQRDWEAITTAQIAGQPMLIIGDIGDNRGTWPDYRLWFLPEPATLDAKATAAPTALLRFRYPEQTPTNAHNPEKTSADARPRGFDAESMAFDLNSQEILILTKREKPARLFALPLTARTALIPNSRITLSQQIRQAPVATARLISTLPPLPAPDFISWLLHPFISPYADQPTDMALSPDGSTLVVLTYSALYFFHRAPGESWKIALAKPTESQALPFIDQWEGISYSPDGKQLLIVREGSGADTLLNLPAPN